MSHLGRVYEVTEDRSEPDLKYLFISRGKKIIVKAVEYSYVQRLNNKNLQSWIWGL